MSEQLEGVPVEEIEISSAQSGTDPLDVPTLEGAPVQEPESLDVGEGASYGYPIQESNEGENPTAIELEGQPAEEAQGTVPWKPSELPEHYSSPEDAYGAARYFQSEYDKAKQQIQKNSDDMDKYKTVAPIAEAIYNDPKLLEMVASHLNGSSSTGQSNVNSNTAAEGAVVNGKQEDPVQMPVAPTKPSDTDLYSTEYQEYQEKYNRYLDQKHSWQEAQLDNRFAEINQKVEGLEQERARSLEMQQKSQLRQQAVLEAQHQHGLNRVEAEKFVEDLASGVVQQNLGMLVNAWKSAQVPDPNQVIQAATVSAARERATQNRTQMAATQSGGQTNPIRDEVEVIGDAMVKMFGVQNDSWV